MTDNDIKEYFTGNYFRLKLTLCKKPNIINYLNNRFSDSSCIKESLDRILYNIPIHPLCPFCGKPVKYLGNEKIFANTCCDEKCHRKSIQLSLEKTMQERYGVSNPGQLPSHKEKTQKTWKKHSKKYKEDIVKRTQQTNLKRYGVTSKSKLESTIQKMEETNLKRYGHICSLRNSEVIKKCQETSIKKYGTIFPVQNKKISNKIFEARKRNHTTKYSMEENYAFLYLSEQYPDIIRQYTSKEYPWHCDFYIPCLDLYIECNFFFTHGKHPFNINNEDDLEKLCDLKLKYRNSYYKEGKWPLQIAIWTQSDVQKRETAKRNHLNYKEFYSLEEVIEWLK